MAGNDCAASVQACVTRIARLDSTGATPASATGMYVTDAIETLSAEEEVETGQEIIVKNACGKNIVDFRDPDRIRRYNLTATFGYPDAEIMELAAGDTLLTTAGNTDGFAVRSLNADPDLNGVSYEVFSRAILNGALAATLPFWKWVMAKTYGWRHNGFAWSNDAMKPAISGFAIENANWGNGPNNDWPAGGPSPARAIMAKRVAAGGVPAAACGYVAIPAQV